MDSLPIRILIIEDSVDDTLLLLRQLRTSHLHHQVRIITDGGVAQEYLTSPLFFSEDLVAIFLDLNIPTVSGVELLEGIRLDERIQHLPVIVMTSSNDPADIETCRELGVASYISKPVSFSAFTKAVADTFHSRRDSVSTFRLMPEKEYSEELLQ